MYTKLYQLADEEGLRAAVELYQKEHYAQHGTLPSDPTYNAARELLYQGWLHADEKSLGDQIMHDLAASERFGKYIIAAG